MNATTTGRRNATTTDAAAALGVSRDRARRLVLKAGVLGVVQLEFVAGRALFPAEQLPAFVAWARGVTP
jgi:hypothetical protein